MVPKPDDPNARTLQNSAPLLIVSALFIVIVPATVKFNRQSGRMAVEVNDIASDRELAAKFVAAEAAFSQEVPH
jgi:hypothetical protein